MTHSRKPTIRSERPARAQGLDPAITAQPRSIPDQLALEASAEPEHSTGMLILVGCVRLTTGKREDALVALAPLVEASQAESGCIGFSIGFDILDDHLLRIFEVFTDEAAWAAHRASGHVAEWEAAASLLGINVVELRKYDAEARA